MNTLFGTESEPSGYDNALLDSAPFYGVDACRAGWFFVGIDREMMFHFDALDNFNDIARLFARAELVLVDIPIGLRSEGPEERRCDLEARRLLGPRRSSVFPAPSRPALDEASHERASTANRETTGRGLSAQSWGIVAKIREVDEFMRRENPGPLVREMHPEVAFWALNGRQPMKHAKKSGLGFTERLYVLARHFRHAPLCLELARDEFRQKDVADDDILDAMVGAVTALQHPGLATVPAEPEKDEYGIPMEMVYAAID